MINIIIPILAIIIVVMQRWSGSSTKSVGKVAEEEEKAEGILAEKVSGDQPWGFALL